MRRCIDSIYFDTTPVSANLMMTWADGLMFQLCQANFTYFDKHAPLDADEVDDIYAPATNKINYPKIQAWRKFINC